MPDKAQALEVVARFMRRAAGLQAALTLFAAAGTILWFVLWWNAYSQSKGPAFELTSLLACAGAAYLTARFLATLRGRLEIESSVVFKMLREQPKQIVWMFPKSTTLNLGALRLEVEKSIVVLTSEGRAHLIHGATRSTLPQLEKAVRQLAPSAFYGWSEQHRRRYKDVTGIVVR